MYRIEIQTNRPWQVSKKYIKPHQWTSICDKKSQKDAEIEISYINQNFEDSSHLLRDFCVKFRIIDSNDNIVWNKETYYKKFHKGESNEQVNLQKRNKGKSYLSNPA